MPTTRLVLDIDTDEGQANVNELAKVLEQFGAKAVRVSDTTAQSVAKVENSYRKVLAQLDPVARRHQEYERQVSAINAAQAAGVGTQAEHARLLELARNRAEGGASAYSTLITSIKGFLGGLVSIGAAIAIVNKAFDEAMEWEREVNQTARAVRNLGTATDITTESAIAFAQEYGKAFSFEDDQVLRAERTLIRFGATTKETMELATRVSGDVARTLGIDLAQAAQMVGKAIQEPGEGMRALKAAGLDVSESSALVAQNLAEQGRVAEAQTVILEDLATKAKGGAAAMGEMEGGVNRLKAAWSNLLGVLGGSASGAGGGGALGAVASVIDGIADAIGGLDSALASLSSKSPILAHLARVAAMPFTGVGVFALGRGGGSTGPAAGPGGPTEQEALDRANVEMQAMNLRLVDALKKGKSEMDRSAREAARAVREQERQLEGLLRKYDPVTAKVNELEKAQRDLNAAIAAGGPGAREYAAALDRVEAELKTTRIQAGQVPLHGAAAAPLDLTKMRAARDVVRDISRETDKSAEAAGVFVGRLDQGADRIERYDRGLELANTYIAEHRTHQEEVAIALAENEQLQERLLELAEEFPGQAKLWADALARVRQSAADIKFAEWAVALSSVADSLGQTNAQLGRMAHQIIGIAAGWKQVKAAKEAGDKVGMAQGYGQMAQSIYGAGTTLGIWGPKGGTSQFGAQKEGNYATEGEAAGQIIGAAIGSIWGPAGAMAGSAIGGALGGIIGSFIKKGADEGLAQLDLIAGEVGTKITKSEGGLGGVLKGIGADVADAIEGITAILGGQLESMPTIFMKVRDDVISVTVNGVRAKFKEVDEAISFAVAQALKGSEISGLSTAMGQLLKGGRFESVEELSGAVEFLKTLEHAASGMTDLAASMQNMVTQTAAAQQQLENFGVKADEASRIAWGAFLNQYQMAVRQVTGRGLSKEEQQKQKQAEIEILNAQRKLAIAKIDLEILETRGKLQGTLVRTELARREVDVLHETLRGYGQYIVQRGQLSDAEKAVLENQLTYLQQVRDALAGMQDVTMGDVRLGGGRRGGGGGGTDWHARMLSAVEGIAAAQRRLVFGDLSPYTGRQKVSAAETEVTRLQALYARGDRRSQTLAMERLPEAVENYLSLFRSTYGATGAYEGVAMRMNEYLSQILRDHGMAPVSVMRQQATENAQAMQRIFQRDARGHLKVRDEDTERELAENRRELQRSNQLSERVVDLLEEMGRTAASNSNAALGSKVRPARPPRIEQTG